MLLNTGIVELGIIVMILGFIILFIALFLIPSKSIDYGGVILIGPIPIIFGSWKFLRRYWWILSIIGIFLLILFLLPAIFNLIDRL
ncbi:TPA: DUF131 domain-containing protein [Candidatus Geothermarchaeota archaeon]|nr:DUF131 domain-containing protein [Candidatus Geothermarchaeota archaeon]HIQ12948.1 DUF131 domain-containing protein [Thermoprotei archaeon]